MIKTGKVKERGSLAVIGMVQCLALPAPVTAQIPCESYEISAIVTMDECPPFGVPPVVPFGINEEGWMVGSFQPCVIGQDRAFMWTPDDGLVVIPTPAGTSRSRALAISGARVVGWYDNADLELGTAGFLYDFAKDEFTSLGTLPSGNTSFAKGINSAGEIVGSWGDVVKGPFPQAFIWRDGEMIDINPDFGSPKSDAIDINANGAITGWSQKDGGERIAFVWKDGRVTSLGPVPGGFTSRGTAINCRGQLTVTGTFNEDHPEGFISGGFLWEAGRWTDLGMLPGYDSMALTGLNDDGTVSGWARDIQNDLNPDTGFIWQDGSMTNLNDLIPPEEQLQLKRALGINASGQIAVRGANADNDVVAVLLTPVQGPLGDLDGDCQVGAGDLLLLLANWGRCNNCENCPADLDNNCAIGVSDLLILLLNWG